MCEVSVRKLLCSCIMMLTLLGCSSSGPHINEAVISDENPLTTQRVLFQVYGLSDNYPFLYSWSASGGELEAWNETQHFVYWITPDAAGTYTVTCTVRDAEDNESIATFTIPVSGRTIVDDLLEPDTEAIRLIKQKDSRIGGIWASVRGNAIRFLSSRVNEDTSWSGDFFVMMEAFDNIYYDYSLYGVESQGKEIIVQRTGEQGTLTCKSCFHYDTISALAIDVIDPALLWVGSDSGLHYYASRTDTWARYKFLEVNDLFEGPDYVYAATDKGIYRLGAPQELIYPEDTCTVYARQDGDSVTVYSVSASVVLKNGEALPVQPDEVVCSLDMDLAGNLWCGKYFWNGSTWQVPEGLDGIRITQSVVSNEGLVYLLSENGSLFLW
ncbi:MAG TPA: hypothetical protein ENN34_03795 [Deltaproteobacteria bacterium]|nr:hypothetical protein [Deltaproteobacteria bacterium]